jgi:molybdenum cofactor synthesis domain-containing protein
MSTAILTVGNEILSGHVLDTNTHWLLGRLFLLGEEVTAAVVIPDDTDQIVRWVEEFSGRVDFLFACGGLGATPDDVTTAAVARAVGKGVEVSEEALAHMEELGNFLLEKGFIKTRMEINDGIRKMATVVEGARVLENRAGFCPGSTLEFKKTRIFILPGVPQELKTIFTDRIEGTYITQRGDRYTEEIVLAEVEARISALLAKLNEQFPGVSIGSYPTYGAKTLVIRAMGQKPEDVKRVLAEIRDYAASLPEI